MSKKLFILFISFTLAIIISGTVSAAADIQVNQSVNNTNPNYNDYVRFTTNVTNNGPDSANGVQITTKLPEGLIYVSDDSNGFYNSTTGIWDIGTINYGDTSKLLNIIAKVNTTGTANNLAAKTGQTNEDPKLDNNAQQTTIIIPKATDIEVTQYMWFPSSSYVYANTPVFVVDVRNVANVDDATNVIVQYKIGSGYEFITLNTRGVGTATYNAATRTITWIIPYMPKGTLTTYNGATTYGGIAFMNVYVKANATGTKTPELTNTAQLISLDQYDYKGSNNQKTLAITVPNAFDIQINQTYLTYVDSLGKKYVTYFITAINNGPDTASGVIIKDLLPNTVQWISDVHTGSYDKNTGIWEIGNLINGQSATLNITAEILATTGIIKNTAELISPLLPYFIDWNYNNNAQTTVFNVTSPNYTPNTKLTITQYLWYSTTFNFGNTPVFVVDVRNDGYGEEYDDAANVIVEYKIADGFEYIGLYTRGVGTATYNAATRTITWIIPYMPKGTLTTYNGATTYGGIAFMNVYVKANATGTKTPELTNTATIISPNYPTQPKKLLPISVASAHDIQVNQIISGTPRYNDNITITITASNNGPQTANGVTIIDLLPKGFQWVSDDSNGAYNKDNGIWNVGDVSNGTTKTLNIIVKITGTGTIKNVAELTGPLLPYFIDWNYNNNAQTCSLEVPAAADIEVSQSSSKTNPNFGDMVTFTIKAINNGPNFATEIKITDIIPSGWKLIAYDTTYGTFSNGIWSINNLLNGNTATLNFIVQILDEKIVINDATRTAGNQYDWNPSNDKASVQINPNLGTIVTFTENDDGHSNTGYNLPFSVNLLGSIYNNIPLWIDVNGFVYFSTDGSYEYVRRNNDYPIWLAHVPNYLDSGRMVYNYIPMIAPFWDDVDLTNSNYGAVYFKNEGDYVTITWVDVPNYHDVFNNRQSGTAITQFNSFQVRITSDGKIGFIYGDMQWDNDWYGEWSETLGRYVYPYSFAGINRGDAVNYYQSWIGSQPLSNLANQMVWFNSVNGGSASLPALDPDIAVSQEASDYNPYTGDTISITITAINNGPEDATGVQVTDIIPEGLKLNSFTTSKGTYDPDTGIWDIGSISVDESSTLTLILKVKNLTGPIVNRAEKTAEDQYDEVTDNDVSEITLNVRKKNT